jgi:alcohol dehydrogenase class IV
MSIRRDASAMHRIREALGARLADVFDGVREHSPVPAVEAGRRALERARADAVIAVGGGSAIVTARAAAILLAEDKPPRELCTRREADGRFTSPRLLAPKLPQWVVPTTPTTAYAKAGSAIQDPATGDRLALFDPKTRAQGIFLDPALALTPPAGLVLSSGLNAFAMAVEGLQANFDDPLAEALLAHAARMIAEWLPRARKAPGDAEPRLRLMLAALLSGQGSDYTGGGLAQAMSHAAGPRSSTANGVVEALLLPHAMRYNAPVTAAGLHRVADALAPPRADGASPTALAIAAVEEILADAEVPARLRDVGIARDVLPEIVRHVLGDWSLTHVPRRVGPDELTELLSAAW